MEKKKSALLNAALAGVIAAGTAVIATSAKAENVKCYGANACKGQGKCGSKATGASCAGTNACKGQGFIEVADAAACTKAGGSTTEPAAKADAKKTEKKAKDAGKAAPAPTTTTP